MIRERFVIRKNIIFSVMATTSDPRYDWCEITVISSLELLTFLWGCVAGGRDTSSLLTVHRIHGIVYLKVTIIYGDNILRIGGIAHFARIKFCAYAACARSRARASMVRAQENRIV